MTMIFNKRRTVIISIIGILLSLPILGMQFSNQVNWSGFDFLIAGLILSTIGVTLDIVLTKAKNRKEKALLLTIVLIIGFLIWAELAVGVFGTPFAGN